MWWNPSMLEPIENVHSIIRESFPNKFYSTLKWLSHRWMHGDIICAATSCHARYIHHGLRCMSCLAIGCVSLLVFGLHCQCKQLQSSPAATRSLQPAMISAIIFCYINDAVTAAMQIWTIHSHREFTIQNENWLAWWIQLAVTAARVTWHRKEN